MTNERRKEKRWDIDNIPQELKDLPIWVGFRFKPQKGKKPKKEPYNAVTGSHAQSNNPKTWCDFNTVISKAEALKFDAIGIGVVEPYVVCDIDNSIKDNEASALAKKIISAFQSYTEYSPSKTGFHIIGKGTIPKDRKLTTIDVEMYSKTRFLTITGDLVDGERSIICDVDVTDLYNELAALDDANKEVNALLKNVSKSKDKESFFKLYEGKWERYNQKLCMRVA